ncbi:hypothetical protein HFN_0621 [Helicobacter fennelliae MRY12-0050]|uniref:Uncharacterized protein n=1 Tax=Helicobacter fennelliae MRY12-0050 TaxID=1325130 RepID=T1CXV8_9HELI|nr:hypothetical protein HFN_0621 [Helicobacter fennelliae MRY12-0050]
MSFISLKFYFLALKLHNLSNSCKLILKSRIFLYAFVFA